MKSSTTLNFLASASIAAAAAFSEAEYDSGHVHSMIMEQKFDSWDRRAAEGAYNSEQYPSVDKFMPCTDGKVVVVEGDANNTFRCNNIDLLNFKPHAALGSITGFGSGSWGWVADDGREFVAIGQQDGAAFIEIGPNGEIIYLGRLPQYSRLQRLSQWREIRMYKNYVLIGSEAYDHGVQIFDMTKLLDLDPANPVNFTLQDQTGHFLNYTEMPWGRLHNLVVNEELGYAAALGSQPRFNHSCADGLVWIDLADPSNPVSPGCAGNDGYVHDAQCVVYHGPDERYEGMDICFGYNEDTLTIYDATNKNGFNSSTIISKLSYVGATYTHQGWFIDQNWHQYILLDDEYDEYDGNVPGGNPVTYIIDVSNLEDPKHSGIYRSKHYGVDHNQYIFDGLAYQSNYGIGLSVLDVSGIPDDPTGGSVEEVGWFDIYPEDDHLENGGVVDFVGTWSHYAGLPSGHIVVNTIERGVFVVKMKGFEKRARGRDMQLLGDFIEGGQRM